MLAYERKRKSHRIAPLGMVYTSNNRQFVRRGVPACAPSGMTHRSSPTVSLCYIFDYLWRCVSSVCVFVVRFFPSHALIGMILVFLWISPTSAQTLIIDEASGTVYHVEEYVSANFPVGMAFAPDGRLFYNEKTTGNVRVVSGDGSQQFAPVINLPTDALQERGMLGIALDPAFEENGFVYVVHTLEGTQRDYPANRLVRFQVDDNNQGQDLVELFRLPVENGLLLHNGGNVHFDDEGYLYLSLGDYGDAFNAQDLTTSQGAIHRFEIRDGELIPAADNPFGADNSIYAYGFRNPFDFTIDPLSEALFVGESGTTCDDEINLVLPGMNYGWGEDYLCVGQGDIAGLDDYMPPLLSFTPTVSPTGIVVYDGEAFPQWQGNLLFCEWNTGKLKRVVLDDSRQAALEVHEINLGDDTCRLDLVIGPEGGLYFGTVGSGEGAIMRLLPA